MNKQQAIKLVKESLINAIRDTGNKGFQLSQQRVPVITGYLKASGSGKDIDDGFILNYSADYAEFPERGVKPGIRNVGTYRKKNGTIVKAYSYFSSGQKPQYYIKSSLTEAFAQDFVNNFDAALRSKGIKATRI